MSSYLSSEYKIVNPQPLLNTALIVNTLDGLQSKYDQNSALIEATISKYEALRGLSDMDNEYTAGRVKEAESAIENYRRGGANLAFGSVRDSMLTAFEGVANDPIVQNGVQQKVKWDNFNAEVAKLKADPKTAGMYSNLNYEYTLNKAGFSDYIQGKTKKLGDLTYRNYEDVSANYSKRLKEYVEQYDDEQYLGQEAKGKYHTVDIYGKRVLAGDLENFLKQTTTPQEAEQLTINAWGRFKDTDDKTASELLLPAYKERLKGLKEQEAILKAKSDSGDKTASKELSLIKGSIAETNSIVEKNAFTKEDLYSEYKNSFIKNMASLYDKNIITKKDIDDIIFQETKFDVGNMQWELSYDQKEREIKAKETETQRLKNIGQGTITDYPEELTSKDKTEYAIFMGDKDLAFNKASDILSKLDPKFATMNKTERGTYLANLDLDDPTSLDLDKITPEMRNAVNSYKKLHKQAVTFYTGEIKKSESLVIGSFNDMQESYLKGSELNIDNVGEYLPYTAQVIKDAKNRGKKIEWDAIPQDLKYAIQAEQLQQYAREGRLSEDNAKIIRTNALILKNKIKDKSISSNIDAVDKKIGEDLGYFDLEWKRAKQMANNVGVFFKNRLAVPAAAIDIVNEGFNYGAKNYLKKINSKEYQYEKMDKERGLVNRALEPIFKEEENFRNIEARDLLGKENIGIRFENYTKGLDAQTKERFGSDSPFQKSKKAVIFSTDLKEQKEKAIILKQAIIAQFPDNPTPEGSEFIIKEQGKGYMVSYQVKGQGNDESLKLAEPVYLDKLPEEIQQNFQKTQDDWSKSMFNPNFKIPSFNIKSPKNKEQSEKILNNLVAYDNISKNVIDNLIQSDILLDNSSYIAKYISDANQIKHKKSLENFSNQVYSTDTYKVNGQLISKVTYKDIVSGLTVTKTLKPHPTPNEQVESIDIHLSLMQQVDGLKKEQLSKLK